MWLSEEKPESVPWIKRPKHAGMVSDIDHSKQRQGAEPKRTYRPEQYADTARAMALDDE